MSETYQEIVAGEALVRAAPGARHELICQRLHERLWPVLADQTRFRLLPPREAVRTDPATLLRPDLVLIEVASGKPWLVAEVVDAVDHKPDTVTKKTLYEDLRLPRLWMVDPRYDNVEVYHASAYGIVLREILTVRQVLEEPALAGLRLELRELFAEGVD